MTGLETAAIVLSAMGLGVAFALMIYLLTLTWEDWP